MEADRHRSADSRAAARTARPFSSREIALLGLMAALWGAIEISVGGMIKSWHIPFGGALLSTFGVVVLLTARASVPRKWSSLIVGVVAAGIRFASGFGGAMFAALGIVAEATIVECVLSFLPRGQGARILAGVLAVLWALAHPFLVQGYLAGLGPEKVYSFTISPIAGEGPLGSGQVLLVVFFLMLIHISLGVSAVMFVDRILLAPYARARRRGAGEARPEGERAKTSRGGTTSALLLLAVVLVSAASSPAQAQVADDANPVAGGPSTDDAYTLPELTVFGTRLLGPYSVFYLGPNDIEDAGAEDLSEALELVPGMVVRTDSRGEARLSTRGLAEREMVVLVDGVPIADPYTGSVNSAMVLSGALGAVRVIKGPAASVYGANALGGIVEVTTVAQDRSGFAYQLAGGSDGRHSGYVSGGGRLGGLHLAGGIAANARSDFRLPGSFESARWEDGGLRQFSGHEQVLVWGRGSWSLGPRTTASLSTQVADGRHDVPASAVSDRPRFWRFPYWRETRTVGSLGWRPSDDLMVEGRVYYGTNDNELAAYSDPERTVRRWLSSVANRALGGYAFSEFRGIEGQRISAGINMREDRASLQPDVAAPWSDYRATTASVFGQDILSLGADDRLSFALNSDMMLGEDRSLGSWNPQASWSHRLNEELSLRLLVGGKTRFPTLKEWFSPEIGNVNLRPERSASVEVEVARRTSSGSRLSLLAFSQRVRDMIVSAGSGSPAENLGAVDSWGAELGVRQRLSSVLDVDLNLAMTSAKDTDGNAEVPLVPKTMCSLSASYSQGPGSCLARIVRVGSRRGLTDGTLAPYVLMDLRGGLDTRLGEVFLGVENVFDVLYEDEDGFPQPGRSFEVGISRELYH
jgi:outer membrane cobalamin receptor